MSSPNRVLITGDSRAIGLTFAKHYKSHGLSVIATVRDPANTNEILRLDAANEESNLEAAATVGSNTPIDLPSNNAVNAHGPWLVTRAFLPNLEFAANIERNTSGALNAYRSSKTALNSLTKSLSVDLKPHGITCILLHPGYVQTDMTAHNGEITTEESVAGLTTILSNATADDNGRFYHTNGTILPW
ncbi:unnamed protein product [Aphanomyces euteiches]